MSIVTCCFIGGPMHGARVPRANVRWENNGRAIAEPFFGQPVAYRTHGGVIFTPHNDPMIILLYDGEAR